MITTSDPRVTYIDLQWPTVTYSDLQWPTVTLRWPILTLHTSSYLYLPHLIHTGLNHGDLEKYGGRNVVVVVVVVATKFNVKHQGKVYHHPPSTIHKWPLSDLPRSTPCPSLSLVLYTKFGCHPPPPTTTGSLNKWLDEPVRGHVRLVKVKGGM